MNNIVSQFISLQTGLLYALAEAKVLELGETLQAASIEPSSAISCKGMDLNFTCRNAGFGNDVATEVSKSI